MLNQLRIKHFAIIDEVIVDFASGSSVLTGETGAGKSILLDALSMVLGDRADKSVVRHGQERADITAVFDISNIPAAHTWLDQHDLDVDNDVILRRTISTEGKSKAFINGTPVTLQNIRTLAEMLVDIHGQHEHQSLMKPEVQLARLDRYAKNEDLLKQCLNNYQTIKETEAALQKLQGASSEDRQARIALLQFQCDELEQLAIQEDEFAQLEQEHKRLANGGRLLDTVNRTIYQLYEAEGENTYSQLNKLIYDIDDISHLDAKLTPIKEMLDTTSIHLREAINELTDYASRVDIDPKRIEWLDQRLSAINDIARKHRVEPEQLAHLHTQLQDELATLQSAGDSIAQLTEQLAALETNYLKTAETLSRRRQLASETIAAQVTEYMQTMGMPGGEFSISVAFDMNGVKKQTGMDSIEYQVTANTGMALKPLRKVASGGELSRISLAIQMATVEAETIPTLIFDEVDSGIGGGIAEVVGKHLRQLAAHRQVLCVTHLPQVAAQAERHLYVSKANDNGNAITASNVNSLSQDERIEEIARMLGGVDVTPQSRLHAKEMLSNAVN